MSKFSNYLFIFMEYPPLAFGCKLKLSKERPNFPSNLLPTSFILAIKFIINLYKLILIYIIILHLFMKTIIIK